jgi:hypothetical protein
VLGRSRSSAPVDVVLRCTWLQHFWNSLLFNSKGDVFKRVVVMSESACRHEKNAENQLPAGIANAEVTKL